MPHPRSPSASPKSPKSRLLALRLLAMGCLLVFGVVIGGYVLSRSHSFQIFGDIVARAPTERPRIALTLDDGPSGAHTQDVLDMLEAFDVPATFFLVGRSMEEQPEATAAIIAAGHEIGNHSYAHDRLVLKSRDTIREDLERTDAIIRGAGYTGPIQFRPPYGKKLFNLPRVLEEQERPSIVWSIAPEQAVRGLDTDEAKIAAMIEATVTSTEAGDIILLHPMFAGRANTRAALPRILEGLKARGFEFVRLTDLLEDASETSRDEPK